MTQKDTISFPFEDVCSMLHLGTVEGQPSPVTGGLLHKMYELKTTQGKYAVKLLNPEIMKRPDVLRNILASEQIGATAKENHLPAVAAKVIDNRLIHCLNGQYFILYDWVEGKSIFMEDIQPQHCEKIGSILADIHKTDFRIAAKSDTSAENTIIPWNLYCIKGLECSAVWAKDIGQLREKLSHWSTLAAKAEQTLSSETVISHRDLDPKNVLWNNGTPFLIDWECAGAINPMKDLIETASYWSSDKDDQLDRQKFLAFLQGYQSRAGKHKADWQAVLYSGFSAKLGWLEYNLKRSLRMECTDDEEQKLGTNQAVATLRSIQKYADQIPELEKWLTK